MFTGLMSPTHVIMILALFLLLFGAKRLPEMGRGLGSGLREFKTGITEQVESVRPDAELKGADRTDAAATDAVQAAALQASSRSD